MIVPHPDDDRDLEILAPVPADLEAWWAAQSAASREPEG